MANKIVPINKKETKFFGDRIVENFWKPKKTTSCTQSGQKNVIISLLQNVQSGFVCVCSEKLEDKDLIKLLFDLSKKIRVYILVNDYSKELDNINEKALIRYGINNIGSFVLVNPNSNVPKGICFGGQMTDESFQTTRFSFELRNFEIKELFRHFCYHFWGTAKMEAIDKNSINSKPIDIYYDADKYGGKDYVFGTLFDFVEKTFRDRTSSILAKKKHYRLKLSWKLHRIWVTTRKKSFYQKRYLKYSSQYSKTMKFLFRSLICRKIFLFIYQQMQKSTICTYNGTTKRIRSTTNCQCYCRISKIWKRKKILFPKR